MSLYLKLSLCATSASKQDLQFSSQHPACSKYQPHICRKRQKGAGHGKLLVCSARLCNPRLGQRGIQEPLTVGGIAYIAKTALNQQTRNAQLKLFSGSTRKALSNLPGQAQKLLARAFAGKVRGRLVAAAWAGTAFSLDLNITGRYAEQLLCKSGKRLPQGGTSHLRVLRRFYKSSVQKQPPFFHFVRHISDTLLLMTCRSCEQNSDSTFRDSENANDDWNSGLPDIFDVRTINRTFGSPL